MVPARRLAREPALDGLRCLAVLLVMAHHAVAYFVPGLLPVLATGGYVGVDLFFVLSGFLITALLLQESEETGTVSLGAFWQRRAARLLPALVLVLVTWTLARGSDGVQPWRALLRIDAIVVSGTTNWFVVQGVDTGTGLGQMWSLAVETQFYLLWPLLVLLAVRRRLGVRAQVVLLGCGIAASALQRALLWQASGEWTQVYFRTDARADALLVGALAAVLWRARVLDPQRVARLVPAALVLLLLWAQFVPVQQPLLYRGGFTVGALLGAVLVVGVQGTSGRVPGLLRSAPLVHVGAVSYALYLWHVPVDTFFAFAVELDAWPRLVLSTTVSLVLAVLSTYLLERPVQRAVAGRRAGQSALVG